MSIYHRFYTENFECKIHTKVEDDVCNGKKKANSVVKNFMTEPDLVKAVLSLKTKNYEGLDWIPQRFQTDGIQFLIRPLRVLFRKIVQQRKLPEQWLFSKIPPIPKKGNKANIENYHPVANFCSTTNFEKLIF
jgi:hypothetical protein